MAQITNTILLVRPTNIRANEQTAVNNYYQKEASHLSSDSIQEIANKEFDHFVKKLNEIGVETLIFEQKDKLDTPDAHFPNNWISFHENNTVVLYPMFAPNRRKERRKDVLEFVRDHGFIIEHKIDYSTLELSNFFLEGTGSLILDRTNKKAYCALSQRANKKPFLTFCEDLGYTPIPFTANQTVHGKRKAIYHTNVMMCIAETFAVICLDAIDDKNEKELVVKHLSSNGKEIIDISEEQVVNFSGNLLQVIGKNEERFLVMSSSAYHALNKEQINRITSHNKIIHAPLDMIESCGGGSARCMMAEVFLSKE